MSPGTALNSRNPGSKATGAGVEWEILTRRPNSRRGQGSSVRRPIQDDQPPRRLRSQCYHQHTFCSHWSRILTSSRTQRLHAAQISSSSILSLSLLPTALALSLDSNPRVHRGARPPEQARKKARQCRLRLPTAHKTGRTPFTTSLGLEGPHCSDPPPPPAYLRYSKLSSMHLSLGALTYPSPYLL